MPDPTDPKPKKKQIKVSKSRKDAATTGEQKFATTSYVTKSMEGAAAPRVGGPAPKPSGIQAASKKQIKISRKMSGKPGGGASKAAKVSVKRMR